MRYALISGGLGLIGSFIARQLIEGDLIDKVVCLDHFGRYVSSSRSDFVDFRKLRLEGIAERTIIERGEARHLSVVSNLMEKYRPEYIFHLAGLPLAKLRNLNNEEAREGSVDSTCHFLETIAQINARDGYLPKRFVYASSSMVYGDFITAEATEEHPTAPKEIYGTMKLAGENVTLGLGRFYGIPVSIVRPSAVFGPTDMNQRVSQIFLDKAMRGQTLSIQGADEALDFTYVKDVANGFILAAVMEKGENEIFNITHGKAHTLLEYAQCLKKHFPDLKYEIVERDGFRPKRGTLSIEKARALLGYEPQYSLQKGIDEYVAFKREHATPLHEE